MKTSRFLIAALCALLVIPCTQGMTVIPPTFDELVGEAELIFQGTVTDVKSQWIGEGAQRHIVSYVTVQVEDAIKGSPGATYTMRMLGGTVDGTTQGVSDAPEFKPGDRDILFVQNNGKQFIPLVGIMHGRFKVQKDEQTGADIVLTNEGKALTDLAKLGKSEEAIQENANDANAKALNASAFKAAIKAKVAQAGK